jgi:hypothetical protein
VAIARVPIQRCHPGELGGGRYMDRTCDPYDVNVVLYR